MLHDPATAVPLTPDRLARVKRSYTTRHVDLRDVTMLATTGTPEPGDVVIARVVRLGQHQKLESPDGRRQSMFVGDEVLVTYANRYAPAQYEAEVPVALGPCDLVAAGGVAADALCWHSTKNAPTGIEVLGFATDSHGRRVNLNDHRAIPSGSAAPARRPWTIVIAGTSMDSGKTTTAAGLIRGFVARGLAVGAAKVTGTGAGGDVWLMADSGAAPCLDFTSVGMASTYLMGCERITEGFVALTGALADAAVDVAVIEIADGLYQAETRDLLISPDLATRCDAVVFAAGDAAGAVAGVDRLAAIGVPVHAVSGLFTASPLAVREAREALELPVLTLADLEAAEHRLCAGAPAFAAAS